jgi:hypothetical protein
LKTYSVLLFYFNIKKKLNLNNSCYLNEINSLFSLK